MKSEEHCAHDHPPRAAHVLAPTSVVERAAALFRAAGDPARLRLLERLAHEGEHCVSELAAASGEGMSTISQRLRLLRGEHLVSRRREGKHVYYGLADAHVRALILAALDHAAEAEPRGARAPHEEEDR